MTDKNLNLANSALRLVVAYDDLMRCYTGPVSDLTKADNAAIDEAYDQMVAAARITLDVTARSTPPAPEKHMDGDYVLKSEAWDAAQKSFSKGYAKAIEAAAKVADDEDGHFTWAGQDRNARMLQQCASEIAASIRALKGKSPSPQPRAEGQTHG